ncbi:hypothetical protein [Marinobacter mobilis]|uniref:Uncharacterized protein n=1 Tax=Marinobacter mobilis TaxID=488533 RepID=A0A1H2S2L0_9GAMM|nr:hypothetical protein [Marinobacter mobilis]SDW25793.1 hypothetical protein SAMN04487960_1022 [Marinobacter mobilis]
MKIDFILLGVFFETISRFFVVFFVPVWGGGHAKELPVPSLSINYFGDLRDIDGLTGEVEKRFFEKNLCKAEISNDSDFELFLDGNVVGEYGPVFISYTIIQRFEKDPIFRILGMESVENSDRLKRTPVFVGSWTSYLESLDFQSLALDICSSYHEMVEVPLLNRLE